jgi:hypothetical protein
MPVTGPLLEKGTAQLCCLLEPFSAWPGLAFEGETRKRKGVSRK